MFFFSVDLFCLFWSSRDHNWIVRSLQPTPVLLASQGICFSSDLTTLLHTILIYLRIDVLPKRFTFTNKSSVRCFNYYYYGYGPSRLVSNKKFPTRHYFDSIWPMSIDLLGPKNSEAIYYRDGRRQRHFKCSYILNIAFAKIGLGMHPLPSWPRRHRPQLFIC